MTIPTPDQDTAGSRTALRATGGAPVGAVSIAQAVAEAVRTVEGVAEFSPGRGVEAATYGPGKRVVGVVVAHSVSTPFRLEIHIVAAQRHLDALTSRPQSCDDATRTDGAPVLPALAGQVRGVAVSAALALGVAIETVDVYIDDIQ